jgi:hypothetical protein
MRAERLLIILLRVSAGVLLLALAAVFLPHKCMAEINRAIGLGHLPHTAIVGYLTRSLSALYAFHGALALCLSMDVRRFRPVIICYSAVAVAFGALLLALDIYLGMPWPWIAVEGPGVIVIYAVMLGLAISVCDK